MSGLLLNGIIYLFFIFFFLEGGGGHVWSTLRLRLGIVSGWGIHKFKCLWGMFDTYILGRDVEQSSQWVVSRPDNLARKQ